MKVVVAMSGGVDSSVAALLLKKKGYQVIGLFMRNWDSTLNDDLRGNPFYENYICPQEKDYHDAQEICKKLEIPLHRVDFIQEYWDEVFSYFLSELKKNRTPNPDIMCNKYIKFDLFLKKAQELGADLIATGHYARFIDGKLKKAIDDNKDQTYFLSQVPLDNFKNVIFPLGELKKTDVKKIAFENNLKVAEKKESMGICFIGKRNFKEFLKNYLPAQPGKIKNIETDEEIGEHEGLMYYTIGQRRGLNIGGSKQRLFVVGKDLSNNCLFVATEEKYLLSDEAVIENMNWLAPIKKNCHAKFRYRQKEYPVEIIAQGDNWVRIKYQDVKAVTPGQACVFYDQDICLGGGLIKEVYFKGKVKKVV